MRAFGVLLAVIVGVVLWGLTLIFLNSNPVGRTDSSDCLVFFSPAIGLVLPASLRLLELERHVLAAWLAALAPLLGVLNVGLAMLIALATGTTPDSWNLPCVVAILIWAVPAVTLFRKLGAEAGEPPANASSALKK